MPGNALEIRQKPSDPIGVKSAHVVRSPNKRAMRKAGGIEMAAYLNRKRKPGEGKLAVVDGPTGNN